MRLYFSFVFFLLFLVVIVGCTSSECNTDAECTTPYFTGICSDDKCVYTPIANECGNGICEVQADENECSCTEDCGVCAGTVAGAPALRLSCDAQNACTSDVLKQTLESYTSTPLRNGGDTFMVISSFNDPFNLRRDELNVELYLSAQNAANSNYRVTSIDVSAQSADRQTIILASKSVNKPILGSGREQGMTEKIRFDFPTGKLQDSIQNIQMIVQYEYTSTTGSTQTQRRGQLTNNFRNIQLTYVVPTAAYECPSCDDNNEGTEDICDASTNFFCVHTPRAGVCGNFKCEKDSGENSCTCQSDCGICAKETVYLQYACQESQCVGAAKTGMSVTPERIFDSRQLSGFELSNTYGYNNPFNVKTDKITLDMQLKSVDPLITSISIDAVRVLEGTSIIAELEQKFALPQVGSSVVIPVAINALSEAESSKVLTLRVEYSFMRSGIAQNSQFTKTLNRATYLGP